MTPRAPIYLSMVSVTAMLTLLAACGGSDDDNEIEFPPQPNAVAPVAVDDRITGAVGHPVTVKVLANDSDANNDMDPATVRLVNPPSGALLDAGGRKLNVPGQGAWVVNDAGDVTFTPIANFTGAASVVQYTVADRTRLVSAPANIQVLIQTNGGGGSGGQTVDALVGQWLPRACGDVGLGGGNSTSRYGHRYAKTGADTISMTPVMYRYSAANCGGSRTQVNTGNNVTENARLVSSESASGYAVYRVQASPVMPNGQPGPTYQRSFIFTPGGQVCFHSATETISTAEIVQRLIDLKDESDPNSSNCGSWER